MQSESHNSSKVVCKYLCTIESEYLFLTQMKFTHIVQWVVYSFTLALYDKSFIKAYGEFL